MTAPRTRGAKIARRRARLEQAVEPRERFRAALDLLQVAVTDRDHALGEIVFDKAADQLVALADIVLASVGVGREEVLGMRYLPPHLEDPGSPGWLLPEELRRRRRSWQKCKTRDVIYEQVAAGLHDCALCGAQSVLVGGDSYLVIDHIVPLARGGTSVAANLQVLCEPCNSRKGATL